MSSLRDIDDLCPGNLQAIPLLCGSINHTLSLSPRHQNWHMQPGHGVPQILVARLCDDCFENGP